MANLEKYPLPLKDLKTGTRVVGQIGSSTFEALKPSLGRYVERTVIKILSKRSKF